MTNPDLNPREKAEYVEFKTKAKFLGINDKDSLLQVVKGRLSLHTWKMVGGFMLALLGLVIAPFLFMIGIPMMLGGVWYIVAGNKQRGMMKRVATTYAREDLGVDITF
ncbi:hypothetical protein [Marinobacter salsuginis]|uniref:hypothetical protein n=1 Tax=Marinobacter salsuginis TaxID=418719 RepID=UPI001AE0D544|nr:hypothetical protein [Marinobacter salsuginis]QTN42031.1 hypothetical protein HZ997_01240 [Marinobacter salsuginis]